MRILRPSRLRLGAGLVLLAACSSGNSSTSPGGNTVPGSPTIVSVGAGDGSAIVTFTAPTSNGGAAITTYTVTCSPASGTSRSQSATDSPITVTGLTNGTQYQCSVTATNSVGTGVASGLMSVTPLVAATAPSAPLSVTATAGVGAAVVSFATPSSNGGSSITSYEVVCSAGASSIATTGTTSPITVGGLTGGVTYSCTVTARNAVGVSPASSAASVTPTSTASVPGAPTAVTATAGNAQATVSFTAPASNGGSAITGYTVTCSAGSTTKTGTGTASPIIVTGLTNGTAYSCSVAAANAAGTGASSSSVSVTPSSGTSSTAGVACTLSYNAFNSSSRVNLQSTSSWSCTSTTRTVTGNGVPNHAVNSGSFATAVGAITVNQSFTLTPSVIAPNGTYQTRGTMGYALNSVKFDPATDGGCTNTATGTGNNQGCVAAGAGPQPQTYPWYLEAIGGSFQFGTDENNAHTQPDGAYHYHGMPENYVTLLGGGTGMRLVGFFLDGFPVYARYGYTVATDAASGTSVMRSSWQVKSTPDAGRPSTSVFAMGTFTQDYQYVAGSGDLDECNGRFGVTPEFPAGIYHYYITSSFPYIARCYKGR